MDKPSQKPKRPNFSCGPCVKYPTWSWERYNRDILGRSHRDPASIDLINHVTEESRRLLGIPDDYHITIVAGSDTGAFEMAMWNLLGMDGVGVDVYAWEHFSRIWLTDILKQLKLSDTAVYDADFGEIPDLSTMSADRDAVFVWNGTTSGVRIPVDFRFPERGKGLRLCDATSGVFAYELPWQDLDVVTWSWQKSMGGEAQHGMLVMSPRAIDRIRRYRPSWPIPKIFEIWKENDIKWKIFEGQPNNTPSMLCIDDARLSLEWIDSIGGVEGTRKRIQANTDVVSEWIDRQDWLDFLPKQEAIRSKTSHCFQITHPFVLALPENEQADFIAKIRHLMAEEHLAYDIASYGTAPLGLRFWSGATVEADDLRCALEWLTWAFHQTLTTYRAES